MKNIIINNPGVQLPNIPNPVQKTKLETQIAALKSQEWETQQQLSYWETKAKKADNFANCLEKADEFASKLLSEAVEIENAKEQADKDYLKVLIRNQVEFDLKFEAGAEAFAKLVWQATERKVSGLRTELKDLQGEIQREERKFARLEARRQWRNLLVCEYRKSIGCFGSYCANCQANYAAASSQPVERV